MQPGSQGAAWDERWRDLPDAELREPARFGDPAVNGAYLSRLMEAGRLDEWREFAQDNPHLDLSLDADGPRLDGVVADLEEAGVPWPCAQLHRDDRQFRALAAAELARLGFDADSPTAPAPVGGRGRRAR